MIMVILLEMLSLKFLQVAPKIALFFILEPLISRYSTIRIIKLMHQLGVLVFDFLTLKGWITDTGHLLGKHLIGVPLVLGLTIVDVEERGFLEVS